VIAFLFGPLPIAIFTSIVVMAGFILPSIWELLNTPPIRVIRQETRSKRSFAFMFLAGVLSLAVFSMALSENIQLSGLMLAAILLLSAILYGVVWSLLKFFKRSKISFRDIYGHLHIRFTDYGAGFGLEFNYCINCITHRSAALATTITRRNAKSICVWLAAF
jgi:predicted lysophospholipase L1 biosynthesis ABC-type transport system permease subunit